MDTQLFVKSNKELFSKLTRDGLLILGPGDEFMYILKGAANFIWDEADGKKTVKEIAERMSREFDIDLKVAEKDVTAFLDDTIREKSALFAFSKTRY